MRAILEQIMVVCQGDPTAIRGVFVQQGSWLGFCLSAIIIGSGIYCATIDLGRAPLQACYRAIKFPLLLLLTAAGNALLNGMLAMSFPSLSPE